MIFMQPTTIIRNEKVHLSLASLIITIIVSLIIIGVGLIIPIYRTINNQDIYISFIMMLTTIIIFFPVFMYAPKRIILSDKQLILQKRIGCLHLSYSEMAEVCIYNTNNPFAEIRAFGSGGYLGFIGNFYSREIGFYTAYVGDYSQTFLVKMKSGKKYLFSCEHHTDIVFTIKQKL